MSPHYGIAPHLDRFQRMKMERMKVLLQEIKEAGTVPVKRFLGSIAVSHGIRRNTAWEYIKDWTDAGYITVKNSMLIYKEITPEEIIDKENTDSS